MRPIRVTIVKPSKYAADGYVDRFRWGFMPNSTLPYLHSLTPAEMAGAPVEVHAIDEYVYTDTDYLSLLRPADGRANLVALVGVQSHQLHRAIDLAAYAREHGSLAIIGGPHAMTCDTSMLHDSGVSFALSEAELVWPTVLADAARGQLRPVYGAEQRWMTELESPVLKPPPPTDLRRYIIPMLGVYPARGCPFTCNFCAVIKIAGRRMRSQSVQTTMASLRAAKAAGVRMIMFTSDNFNKYTDAEALLSAMIEEGLGLKFFVQCDTQVARQPQLVALLGKAGCFQMFVGVESFNRRTLLAAKKAQNRPESYDEIVRLCRAHGISSHFSNIIGFPQDAERDVCCHLRMLREIDPTWASFYILCPMPGTEQYDEFLSQGLIDEPNLDRFDAASLTWRHPHFARSRLRSLLFRCYRDFYSAGHLASGVLRFSGGGGVGRRRAGELVGGLGFWLFHRYCTGRKMAPMAGGVARVRRDHVGDYMPLRRKTYGFELAPLPRSLTLSEAESQWNRTLNPRAQPHVPVTLGLPSVAAR